MILDLPLYEFLYFRFPELQDVLTKQDYCKISEHHTMCKFKGPASDCLPSEFGISDNLKEALVNELNK